MAEEVLRIIARLNVGGPAKHVYWLSNGLSEQGWKHSLLYGRVEENEDELNLFESDTPVHLIELPIMARSINPVKDIKTILFILRFLKQNPQIKICHTHTSKAGFVGRIAAFLHNITKGKQAVKVLHTFHGHTFNGYFTGLKQALFLFIERFLAAFCTDIIITISQKQQDEIAGKYRVGQLHKHRIIPLGLDFSFAGKLDRTALRKQFNIPSEARVFAIVGRVAPIKDHLLFIESIRAFQEKNPESDCWFCIIGDGDPDLMQKCRERVSELQLKNTIFTGNQNNPAEIYGLPDFLVLSSINEGTPVSILEAFTARIPVISATVGGVSDIIGDNKRGLLVKERNPEDFARCYEEALTKDWAETVEAAAKYVQEKHSLTNLANSIKNLYDSLLQTP
jgi:glycosyltransferase involved in cell wall biosynthesis